jgi:hypothetical protein
VSESHLDEISNFVECQKARFGNMFLPYLDALLCPF